MKGFVIHMILLTMILSAACIRKAEDMSGPTIGTLDIMADENIMEIVQQQEEIFERNYKYARLNVTYTNEYDLFDLFLADSTDVIFSTRSLRDDEKAYLSSQAALARETVFATGAIAFITNPSYPDTAYTYERLLGMMQDSSSGKRFIIENVKSGISALVLEWLDRKELPGHVYALQSKKEVLDYVKEYNNAIGLIDYSDISDSDSQFTREVLANYNLLAISRPVDSLQMGYLRPFQYNLQERKYPFTRDLYFISKTGHTDVGTGFVSFICGEIGQKIVLKAGLLPKFQSARYIEIYPTPDIKVVK